MARSMDHDGSYRQFNPATHCVEMADGTVVAAELFFDITCLADLLYVARIRESQKQECISGYANG